MGLDVWFRQDVARILASAQETLANSFSAVQPLDQEAAGAYRQGFADALQAVGVAFGVSDAPRVPGFECEKIVDAVPCRPIAVHDRLGDESWQ